MEKLSEKLEMDLLLIKNMEEVVAESEEHESIIDLVDLLFENQILDKEQFLMEVSELAKKGYVETDLLESIEEEFEEYKGIEDELNIEVENEWDMLQFDVLKYRLENEYNVEIRLENLPYEHIRWIENKEEVDLSKLTGTSDIVA